MTDQGIIDALRAEREKIALSLREVDRLINVAAARFSWHAPRQHCGTTYQPHSPHLWGDGKTDFYCPAGLKGGTR